MYQRMMGHPFMQQEKECAVSTSFPEYLASTSVFDAWREKQAEYEILMVSCI
jgi:hypothetical protein